VILLTLGVSPRQGCVKVSTAAVKRPQGRWLRRDSGVTVVGERRRVDNTMRGKDIPNMPSSALRRLRDGDAQGGSLAIQPDRFGTRYFLIVYPPGITAGERR